MYPGGGLYCYNPHTIEAFQKWLKKKYSSLRDLNKSWDSSYKNFSEVTPPQILPWAGANPLSWMDWRRFATRNLLEFFRWESSLVKEIDSLHPLTSDLITGPMRKSAVPIGQEYWGIAQILDIMGLIVFSYGRATEEKCQVYAAALDAIRSAGVNKKIWITELQGGPTPEGRYTGSDLEKLSWTCLAHGAQGILYMRWKPIPTGFESKILSMRTIQGKSTEREKKAIQVSRTIKKIENVLLESSPSPAQVAINYSFESLISGYGLLAGHLPSLFLRRNVCRFY
jgi:beta-galactosidase